jgi:hypothetical protein
VAKRSNAGCVDAVGYLLLGGVLVAHMSGNTAEGALRFEHGNWAGGLARLSPLPGFLLGAGLGNLAARALARNGRWALCVALLAELAVLGVVSALGWQGLRSTGGTASCATLSRAPRSARKAADFIPGTGTADVCAHAEDTAQGSVASGHRALALAHFG